ncbi:MAG: protein jag [Anaerolineales bacterium]|nr:protein jag [Anaerolineales bacterium]
MTNDTRATLEIIAPTIEEAIEQGLRELGVSQDRVEIEVLDEGVKGIFGLGNRQARIRLVVKNGEDDQAPDTAPVAEEEEIFLPESDDESTDSPTPDLENAKSIAQAIVAELLEKMGIYRAEVEASIIPPKDNLDKPGILVEIYGDDLSILIGKQAETLNALQYITRLIVGKEVGHGVNLSVDVEGYRSRRDQSLRQLARRMASQAVKTGRRQMLEPMPANERRIIHLELRDNDEVTTSSVGEEPRRKVTITPV